MNIDKKQMIKDLFGEEKAPLGILREKVQHFQEAHDQILNLSNDVVDYPLFRVMAQNMKQNLSS